MAKYEAKSGKWATGRLVMGILLLVLFVVVSLQSCMVGLGNSLTGSEEISGSFGFVSALAMLIAGIVGIVTRKSASKGGPFVACGFCWAVYLFSQIGSGSYGDLRVWGYLGFAFGCVYLLAGVRTKKGIFAALAVALVYFLLIGAAGGSADAPTTAESSVSVSSVEKAEAAPAAQEMTVEEKVLLDTADVKITLKGIQTKGMFGPSLSLLIENNTTRSLTFQNRSASVNGYMIDTLLSADVAAGKKANEEMTLMRASLEECGIDTIADVEVQFHVFDSETWKTYLDSETIRVETSAASGFVYTYDDSGDVLFSEGGIEIVAKQFRTDSILGPELKLYIFNGTAQEICVQSCDTSVDGFMVESILSQNVAPGKHALTEVTFLRSDLEANGITEPKELEIAFRIFNADNFATLRETSAVTVSVS